MINFDDIEVLSPVGDMERLDAALDFGADAIYLGGTMFGMRAGPANFNEDELKLAVEKAHSRGVLVYLTCNTLPKNSEIPYFEGFVKIAVEAKIDALIVNDIGLLTMIKQYAPDMEIHISTQAGIVNYATANAFYNMGAKRVVLARELSIEDIAEIRAKTPKELDIECFIHGAMCVSFSGRCLLSSYLVNRDANRGECAQPCRWGYHLMEEKRDGQYFPIYEDKKGTYILNSKDMCLIEHLDKLAKAGIKSFKIEGRAKSSYYVSVVTNAYRMAVDFLRENPNGYDKLPKWIVDEVYKVSHRAYCTGFYFNHPNETEDSQYYGDSGYIRECDVVAIVDGCKDGFIYATQRNKFNLGDKVEILVPKKEPISLEIKEIINEKGERVESANHAMMKLSLPFNSPIEITKNSIIRTQKKQVEI